MCVDFSKYYNWYKKNLIIRYIGRDSCIYTNSTYRLNVILTRKIDHSYKMLMLFQQARQATFYFYTDMFPKCHGAFNTYLKLNLN